MNSWWWYLTRATGIVAAGLAVASLVWGLFFSSRNTGTRRKANWWLALHNWLGGLTLAFIVLHVAFSFLDTDTGLRLVDLVVPNSAAGWAIGWGVVAMWMFVLTVVPSMARIRRRLPRKAWHAVHLISIPAVVLSMVHAFQSGSDATQSFFTRGLALLVGIAVYPVTIRLIGVAQRRRPAPA